MDWGEDSDNVIGWYSERFMDQSCAIKKEDEEPHGPDRSSQMMGGALVGAAFLIGFVAGFFVRF